MVRVCQSYDVDFHVSEQWWESDLRGTLLQRAHYRDEHVLLGRFEQTGEQRDPSSFTDSLLVPGAFTAAPQSQSTTACHLQVLLLLRAQRGRVRNAVQQLHLSQTLMVRALYSTPAHSPPVKCCASQWVNIKKAGSNYKYRIFKVEKTAQTQDLTRVQTFKTQKNSNWASKLAIPNSTYRLKQLILNLTQTSRFMTPQTIQVSNPLIPNATQIQVTRLLTQLLIRCIVALK